ncbi:MarR family transcriptional regulator [Fontimonas sp. SYSU GA230001]|uniref:MarR family winged helix-turn-helix transcriptional regulator n=1 Tax=Fontimonas sp. SYSU GA230001 TaxID=3142450 RepID=UPI0032B38337
MSKTRLPPVTIGSLVLDVGRLIRQDFRRRAQHLGLTQAQWSAIAQLHREPGLTQAALAERLEVHPVTVTQLLDRMEKAGWIRRTAHATDRRAQCVHLTESTEPVLAELARLAAQTRERALRGLSEGERRQFEQLLARVKNNLSSADADAQAAMSHE